MDDVPVLSADTLAILKNFAISAGAVFDDSGDGRQDLAAIQRHFDVKDRDEVFQYHFDNRGVPIDLKLAGVKRELGQTLSSTGLTIWRAAEHLCDWIMRNQSCFEGKTVCELGAGLGLVAILLDKLSICKAIVATDGDDDTVDLLSRNIASSQSVVHSAKLWWRSDGTLDAPFVALCRECCPGNMQDNSKENNEKFPKFDVVCAADVIYEEDQVTPLLATANLLLAAHGSFYLAYARRNVPVDRVLEEAGRQGLRYEIVDRGTQSLEDVYRFYH